MARKRSGLLSAVLVAAAMVVWPGGTAQSQGTRLFQASRDELTAAAQQAEAIATNRKFEPSLRRRKAAEAASIRERLREGDFFVGDRLQITIEGQQLPTDTFAVAAGRVLRLPNLPEIPLQGVLRSELEGYLTEQVRRFVRDAVVHTRSLVRVAVLGEVMRPGFYQVPADELISGIVMQAGGPTQMAMLDEMEMKRGPDVVWSSDDLRVAVRAGLTLDQLGVRSGDQITIGKRKTRNWQAIAQVATVSISLLSALTLLLSRR